MPENPKPADNSQTYDLLPTEFILHRPGKLTNAQTILYEIDMLNFTASRLEERDDWQRWSNLESFLLHYRNLIEFFGKKEKEEDTLSIFSPEDFWTRENIPPDEKLNRLHLEYLWEKYGKRKVGDSTDKISKYLQHCTEQRVVPTDWKVGVMLEKLWPVLQEFERLLPDTSRPWGHTPVGMLVIKDAAFGTGTISRCDSLRHEE